MHFMKPVENGTKSQHGKDKNLPIVPLGATRFHGLLGLKMTIYAHFVLWMILTHKVGQ